MDKVISNEIAANIHLYCVKRFANENNYTENSVKFRQNLENCFLSILDQR